MSRPEFKSEFNEFLQLDNKSWDIPKFGIINYNAATPHNAYVQVSLKGEIDVDSLYYIIGGYIYELDIQLLRPDLLDESRYSITEMEKVVKGKLTAIKVPFKYLTKHDIANMHKAKEDKLVKDVSDKLNITWKSSEGVVISKTVVNTKNKLNRLLTKEDFSDALEEHTQNTKNSLLSKRDKYSPDNWDSLFRKTAMRKQKSVLSVCDSFLDKDLERYYDLLTLLSQSDNISQDLKENTDLQLEIEDVMNSINNWFILQKFQMLKQVRAKL